MGFTTGFTGGVTLTLGLAYLAVINHERNRQSQALHLRSQSQLLNSLVESGPIQPHSRAELTRQSRSTFTETVKYRWNDEVENAVRWVHTTDWSGIREGMEGAVARLLGLGLQNSRESINEAGKHVELKVQEAVDRSRAGAIKGAEQASVSGDRIAAAKIASAKQVSEAGESSPDRLGTSIKEGIDQVGVKAQNAASMTTGAENSAADTKADAGLISSPIRSTVDRGAENSHEIIDKVITEVQSGSTGTVDTARSVSKGIGNDKEAIGNVEAATSLATEKIKSASPSNASGIGISDIEKALHERYEGLKNLDRTVEEVLEERYKPINQRDNTILRGI